MRACDPLSLGQIRLFIRPDRRSALNLLLAALGFDKLTLCGVEMLGGFWVSFPMIGG